MVRAYVCMKISEYPPSPGRVPTFRGQKRQNMVVTRVSHSCFLIELGPICNSMAASLWLKSCEDHNLFKSYNWGLWKNNYRTGPCRVVDGSCGRRTATMHDCRTAKYILSKWAGNHSLKTKKNAFPDEFLKMSTPCVLFTSCADYNINEIIKGVSIDSTQCHDNFELNC